MKYPFLCLASLFAAGVAINHLFVPQSEWGWAGLAFSLAAYSATRLLSTPMVGRPRLLLQFSVLFAFFSSGLLVDAVHHRAAATSISRWTHENVRMPIRLIGRARQFSFSKYSRVNFALDVSRVIFLGDTLTVSGTIMVRVRAGAEKETLKTAHPGDVFEILGDLRALPGLRNPFDFNQGAFLRSKGFSAILDAGSAAVVLREHVHTGITYRLERLRDDIENRIVDSHSSSYSTQLVPAILIGRRKNIESSVRDRFRRSGLSHLLAISGLHVGIIGMALHWMLGIWLSRLRIPFRPRQWSRALLVSLILTIYAVISGGSTSVIRAVLMAAVFLLGRCSDRKIEGANALGLAVLFILLLNPDDLFNPGFQLSVSALAGIFFYLKSSLVRVERTVLGNSNSVRRALGRKIYQSVGVTAFILAFTTPVLLYHFGVSPLGGLVSNIVAIPITGLLLFSGILSTITGPDTGFPLILLAGATDLLSGLLVSVAHGTSLLSDSSLITSSGRHVGTPGLFPLAACFLFIARSRINFRFVSAFGILSVLIVQSSASFFPLERTFRACFFDVGQGDASLFVTPGGKSMLVDTGRGFLSAETIKRYLNGVGLSGLDALVITHPHQDHMGGLIHLVQSVSVRHIYAPREEHILNSISTVNGISDIPFTRISSGDTIVLDPSVRIHVLAPRTESVNQITTNNESIVLRLTYGRISMLLMGDAETSTERYLVRRFNSLLNAQLIKVGHHGSRTSSSLPFVRRVTGAKHVFAIVSVGEGNRFNHPDPGILRRWVKRHSELYLTSRSGAVLIRSDGRSIHIQSWKPSVFDE